MEQVNLQAGLKGLRQSVSQIKALLAWDELKQAEARPGVPPGFCLADPVDQDLRNAYSFFLKTAVEMHSILNDAGNAISDEQRRHFRHQVFLLEQEVNRLDLPKRFIKL